MKRLIFDTNILIKVPDLFLNWNSTYRVLIPDLVIGELRNLVNRIHGISVLLQDISRATEKGFVKIIKVKTDNYPINQSVLADLGLSSVDYQIAQLALDYSKTDHDAILVTEDRKLSRYAKTLGVTVFSLFSLQQELYKYKKINLNDIEGSKNINYYQVKHLIISALFGSFITALLYIVYKYHDIILPFIPIWGKYLLLFIIPFLLYWIRENKPIAYAIPEFIFGYYCTFLAINPLLSSYDFTRIIDFSVSAPIIVGVYVMVRALDNFGRGAEGTILEKYWKKYF